LKLLWGYPETPNYIIFIQRSNAKISGKLSHQFLSLKKYTYRKERENKGSRAVPRAMHLGEKY
jgi:hypothetical protein